MNVHLLQGGGGWLEGEREWGNEGLENCFGDFCLS